MVLMRACLLLGGGFYRKCIITNLYDSPESEGFRENFFNENIFRHLTGGLSGADGKFAR